MPMMSEVRVTSSPTIRSSSRLPAISARTRWKRPERRIACQRSRRARASVSARELPLETAEVGVGGAAGGAADEGRLDGAAGVEDVAGELRRRAGDEGAAVDVQLDDLAARRVREAAPDAGATDAEGLAERGLGELGPRRQALLDHRVVDARDDLLLAGGHAGGHAGAHGPPAPFIRPCGDILVRLSGGSEAEALVLLLELRDAAAGVHQLVRAAGPGRVRRRVDLERQRVALLAVGRAGR